MILPILAAFASVVIPHRKPKPKKRTSTSKKRTTTKGTKGRAAGRAPKAPARPRRQAGDGYHGPTHLGEIEHRLHL